MEQCEICLKLNQKTFEEARKGKILIICQKSIGRIEPCEILKGGLTEKEDPLVDKK